jgi:RNA polymerase sigma factor (sigma-70 family)
MTAVEGYTLRQQPLAALRGPSPLLRLASDERLIALTRSGQQAAFEALVARYQQRLLAFCRHMLRSREDAEDVLQEVFAAAFNAIMADSREINARPWLYRIARNRSLNHLRRTTAIGVDSMDAHFADAGQSTSEKAHGREEFRLLVEDIGHLPESQRSALVLREMDALSYEQIAEVMDTTVPSVKSLLVRARIGLAEAAQARKLTCEEVRFELGETAEGLRSISAPVRRHVKQCDRCRAFRTQLRSNNRALAAIMPLGPLLLLKKTLLVKLGLAKLWAGGAGASGGVATAGAGGAATAGGASAATGSAIAVTGGGFGGIAAGAVAVKAVVVVAAATLVAVGTTKIFHQAPTKRPPSNTPVLSASAPVAETAVTTHHRPFSLSTINAPAHARRARARLHVASTPPPYLRRFAQAGGAGSTSELTATTPDTLAPATAPANTAPPATVPTAAVTQTTSAAPTPTTQEISTTTVFPSSTAGAGATATSGATATTGTAGTTASGETITTTTSLTGATGTTATTGSTAGSTSVAPTGASGSSGSSASASAASASGATGATGS